MAIGSKFIRFICFLILHVDQSLVFCDPINRKEKKKVCYLIKINPEKKLFLGETQFLLSAGGWVE